ncbi:MAG: hypothetical protein EOO38_23305 [Cytophagaceae bacterium]|nr:MAG: hypothetical protein EOO38_23305 [Cytophagaceae bacterium]
MAEKLVFHFEGALSDEHQMNFYEAARFQYAAARLMVKLAQFRATGSFVKNITYKSNFGILLESQNDGSFNINTSSPTPEEGDKKFADLSMADLLAYISERLVEKGDEAALIASVNARRKVVGSKADAIAETLADADAVVSAIAADPEARNALGPDARDAVERRIAEIDREDRLVVRRAEISKIDAPREQKLISMSAPLVSEMAISLRRSASTLRVVAPDEDRRQSVLYLNKRMAQEIETAKVDREITPILCDIVQYNKESGWGKVRLENSADPIVSFSIPSDLKSSLQGLLMDQMKKDKVYVQAYFVRDKANVPTRLIVVGILATPQA